MAESFSISFSRFFLRQISWKPLLFKLTAMRYRTKANLFCLDINITFPNITKSAEDEPLPKFVDVFVSRRGVL